MASAIELGCYGSMTPTTPFWRNDLLVLVARELSTADVANKPLFPENALSGDIHVLLGDQFQPANTQVPALLRRAGVTSVIFSDAAIYVPPEERGPNLCQNMPGVSVSLWGACQTGVVLLTVISHLGSPARPSGTNPASGP
jgi:hypothetical protein